MLFFKSGLYHTFINWNCIKYKSNSYQIHINYIFCCTKMSCSVDFLFISKSRFHHTSIFHWNCNKYISNSYPLQIKSISITRSVIPKWAYLFIFCFLSKSRLYHTYISLKLYLIHIKLIFITDKIHINFVMCCTKMSCSVDLLFFSKSRCHHMSIS